MVSAKRLNPVLLSVVGVVLGAAPIAPGEVAKVRYVGDQVLLKVQLDASITATGSGGVTSDHPVLAEALVSVGAVDVAELFPFDRQGSVLSRIYRLELAPGSDVLSAVGTLVKLECVEFAEPNYVSQISAVPTDASYDLQWGLQKIQCPPAWGMFTGLDNVVIAVVDSGVDYEHVDLADNIWVNSDEIPNNGIDDDENGYIDDYYGWDFVSNDKDPGNSLSDSIHEHGTHVAGIAGAVANNDTRGDVNIVGVLWQCQLMAVRAADYWGSLTDTDISMGVRYAADNGADVINMSFGGYYSSSLVEAAIEYAAGKNAVLCAAAGNEMWDWETYPAAYNEVIAVAATDPDDVASWFTNYGDWVTISAPGEDILSTVLYDAYEFGDGTSMATPFVSGVAGLILGYGREQVPPQFYTRGQVEYVLTETADNIDDENPMYVGLLGAGRVNAASALDYTPPTALAAISVATESGAEENIQVDEQTSTQFKVVGHFTDGTSAEVEETPVWSCRPIRYGQFDAGTNGLFHTSLVPANREVAITATLTRLGSRFQVHRVITIRNDPDVAPLTIKGPDRVNPGASTGYTAELMAPSGEITDVTSQVQWSVIEGTDYGAFDSARTGTLNTSSDSAGQELTIRAVYVDDENRIVYEQTGDVTVLTAARQVAGLLLTGPRNVAAGSADQLTARLVYMGQTAPDDVTTTSTWSVTPTGAGQIISPGRFLAGNVTAATTATITAEYVSDGRVYSSSLAINVTPASAAGETVQESTEPSDSSTSSDDLPLCSVLGLVILAAVLGACAICTQQPRRHG